MRDSGSGGGSGQGVGGGHWAGRLGIESQQRLVFPRLAPPPWALGPTPHSFPRGNRRAGSPGWKIISSCGPPLRPRCVHHTPAGPTCLFSPGLSAEAAFSTSARLKDRKWTSEILVSFKVSVGLDTMSHASAFPIAPRPLQVSIRPSSLVSRERPMG